MAGWISQPCNWSAIEYSLWKEAVLAAVRAGVSSDVAMDRADVILDGMKQRFKEPPPCRK